MFKKYIGFACLIVAVCYFSLSLMITHTLQSCVSKQNKIDSIDVCQRFIANCSSMSELKNKVLFINNYTYFNFMLLDNDRYVLVEPKISRVKRGERFDFNYLNAGQQRSKSNLKQTEKIFDLVTDTKKYFEHKISSISGYQFTNSNNLSGILVVINSLPDLIEDIGMIYVVLAIGFVFSVVLIIYFAYHLSKRYLSPIDTICQTVNDFKMGRFNKKIKSNFLVVEFNRLSHNLNDMAEKLDERQKLQTMFIANVSHDLRSPLTSAYGFLQAICDGLISDETEKKIYIEKTKNKIKELVTTTNDMFDTSKFFLEQNVNIDKQKINIKELIDDVSESFLIQLKNKNITLIKSFSTYDSFVMCDPIKIRRVFYNLLDNALKFTPENGKIEISISLNKTADKYCVSIKDNGIGIDEEEQKYIFEPFYKADTTRNINKNGSGLGLYISKKILEIHGENIKIKSEKNKGCEFIFALEKVD